MRSVVAASVVFGGVGLSAPAHAFCRVTTCDPSEETCSRDADGCLMPGQPVYWASGCVSVAIQEDGSPLHGIDAGELEALAVEALDTWMRVDCGGGRPPSIEVESLGTVACDRVEYNEAGNANILMIRDGDWPYAGSANTLGKTNLVFDPDRGRIYDADIEVNGAGADLSVGDPVVGADLLSILTHEFGHFLGLDHTLDETATMRADYEPSGNGLRTLGQDDIDGICAIYPPDRDASSSSCAPRHGFSADCGGSPPSEEAAGSSSGGSCSLSAPGRRDAERPALFALAVAGFVLRGRAKRRDVRRLE